MQTFRVTLLTLLSLCSVACNVSTTKVEKTRWHDQDAYRLSNAKAEAVIVPAWRRVVHYSRPGEPNVLWTGAEKNFKVGPNDWANYGGEKAWLWPQSEWTDANGKKQDWPPPDDRASSPPMEVLNTGPGTVVLRTAPMKIDGIRLTRSYALMDDGSLVIDSTVDDTQRDRELSRPWAIWSIIQIPRPVAVYATLAGDRRIRVMSKPEIGPWRADADVASVPTTNPADVKYGYDANDLLAEYDDRPYKWLFVHAEPPPREKATPAPAERAQVYLTPRPKKAGDVDYVELEFTGSPSRSSAEMGRLRIVLSIDQPPRNASR